MTPLETYLRELHEIRSSGAAVKETSYYGALSNLLNEIGKTLKPRVRCIINLKNQGAGLPDGGLFTADQLVGAKHFPVHLPDAQENASPLQTLPARGVIEVKSTSDDAWVVADSEQVSKYWNKYKQVLVTNYRDFVLIGRSADGKPVKLETYRLSHSESAFWAAARNPHATAEEHGERFTEYLKRVMLHAAPLTEPKDVAWFLASYARDARARIEGKDLPALTHVRTALEEALGIRFEGEKGEHFFRSTLVQTLFYGIFSAWVLWHKENPQRKEPFDWRSAHWYLHVPMIRSLFHQLSDPSKLKPLDLVEVLNWTAAVLNRVDRSVFFEKFVEGQAVQYFYEPFLEAFDPALRKELGVWYTPSEIVQYMVARVDAVLREELNISDGLADPRVVVLDPCCGTGTYLVEVLRRIADTLKAKGEDAMIAYNLKKAAKERIFGFEILPAPFVVSHLQLGLLLQNLGAPLSDEKERVGVYLTNALTGWEPPSEEVKAKLQQLAFDFPELKQERESADEVKGRHDVLVVIGNPPYNAFAGVSPKEEQGLVEPYKEGLISAWGIKKFNLDDLYVRFFRLAERCIAEKTGKGVVCYVSNFSYLGDPSFVVMRQRFLSEFDALWFDCMNGDSRETGKLTPEGKPDPSVFSTEYNREGIRVGTAVALMVRSESTRGTGASAPRRGGDAAQPHVRFRHFWGVTKRADLLESLNAKDFDAPYESAHPDKNNRFSFRPSEVASRYLSWASLVELCAEPPSNGLMEKRGGALIDINRDALERRMCLYYDPDVDWDTLKALGTGLTEDAARFDAKAARAKVLAAEIYNPHHLRRYALRAFETRWCYFSAVRPLWNEPRPTLWAQCWEGNAFLMTRPAGVASPEGVPFYFTRLLGDNDFLRGHAYYFPLRLRPTPAKKNAAQNALFGESAAPDTAPIANLSPAARAYLAKMGIDNPDADAETAALIWMHALAIGYSPAYLTENADGIRQDFPRVPLPDSKELLLASAALGRQVAALLDTETPVHGVTTGTIRPELSRIAVISHASGGQLNPDAGDFAVTAGWGHAGKGGVVMPGKGKVAERDYTPGERPIETELHSVSEDAAEFNSAHRGRRSATPSPSFVLGETTCDVYLNDVAYWKNVPAKVWDYTIGGYQVIKKWLSYRERDLLGRPLTDTEVREVRDMARRIAAILLLTPELDANYQAIKRASYIW